MSSDQIRIIGVGNPLMADDGVGIEIIHRLEKIQLPEAVELIDGGCGGFKLFPLLSDCRKVLLIDAADFGAVPGTHKIFHNADLPNLLLSDAWQSGHSFNLQEILLTAQKLNQLSPLSLHLIQINTCQPATHLSNEIEAALPGILSNLIADI